MTEERKEYFKKYRKEYLHRIPLDVTHDLHARIKRAAEAKDMKVNTFIKHILNRYLDRYGF